MHALEDIGYFCIDNLPPALLYRFVEISRQSGNEIEKLAVVMDVRGGEEYGGATFDAYFFYFCTGAEGSSVEDKWANPQLILPAAIVDAGKECDLTDFDNTKSHWNFYYDTSMDYLARGSIGYGDTYTQWGMTTKLCPDMAKVTAIRNADKTWQVSLVILDYGAFDSWSDDKSGTENTLTIEFRGKAAKYSGLKTNDLADDFYE